MKHLSRLFAIVGLLFVIKALMVPSKMNLVNIGNITINANDRDKRAEKEE